MIKAVIFDLDGTLVNSLEDLAVACNYALTQLGLATHETEKFKYFVGDGMQKLVERILPEDNQSHELRDKCFQIFIEYYRKHFCDNTTVYAGIKELLFELKNKGIKIATVSNKSDEMTKEVVKKLLPNCFDVIFGKREGIPAKPDPYLTLEAIRIMGVNPEECFFVGDSGTDMMVAINSGCKPIGVLWGFRQAEELISNGCEIIAENPLEILEFI